MNNLLIGLTLFGYYNNFRGVEFYKFKLGVEYELN